MQRLEVWDCSGSCEDGVLRVVVNEVVPGGNEECLAAAKKWAEMILECGPMVSAATVGLGLPQL